MVTPSIFAQHLLSRLGVPVSENNVAALVAVQAIEGGHQANSAWYNPLNTMRSMPGDHDAGLLVKGIKAYANWDDGIEATALTLEQGTATKVAPGFDMSGIFRSLAHSAPADDTIRAWQSSPWGWSKTAHVAPAASYQSYANIVYRGAGAISDFGGGIERFARSNTKYIVGAFVVVGGSFLLIGLAKAARRNRVLRSA